MTNKIKFGSTFYNFTLWKCFKLEMISFIKRLFSKKIIITNKKYVQLGCGIKDVKKKFINLDFYNNKDKNIIFSDFRYPLRFKDNTFFGAFSEHTLEHLTPSNSIKFLSEVHRILTPGSIFRIVVPDLNMYIKFYNGQISNTFFKNFINGCEAIWNITQNFGHLSVWNYEMLKYQLINVGFIKIYKKNYKKGINKNLLIDKKGREIESLYVEAIK